MKTNWQAAIFNIPKVGIVKVDRGCGGVGSVYTFGCEYYEELAFSKQ